MRLPPASVARSVSRTSPHTIVRFRAFFASRWRRAWSSASISMAYTGTPSETRCSVISPWPAPTSIQQYVGYCTGGEIPGKEAAGAEAEPGSGANCARVAECGETPMARAICSRQPASERKCWPSRCRAMRRKCNRKRAAEFWPGGSVLTPGMCSSSVK